MDEQLQPSEEMLAVLATELGLLSIVTTNAGSSQPKPAEPQPMGAPAKGSSLT